MTSASMSFGSNSRYSAPRGAVWAGQAVAALLAGLHRFDQWLVERRKPEVQTVEDVLDWARRIESTDPGFAADLRAAALRSQGD